MMRPFTCVCMMLAAGSLMYLYREKHAAQVIDRQVVDLMKQAAQVRERSAQMRADYAMLNDPERLSQLASQHLSLQPLTPSQFAKLSDLASRLPGPAAAAPEQAPMDDEPPAAAAPQPVAAVPVQAPRPVVASARPIAAPTDSAKTQVASAPTHRPAKPRDGDATVVATLPAPRPAPIPPYSPPASAVYAPIVQAFASQKPAQPAHAPTVQHASAGLPEPYAPAPYVGSALGMARAPLAAPVPVSNATDLGSSYGR